MDFCVFGGPFFDFRVPLGSNLFRPRPTFIPQTAFFPCTSSFLAIVHSHRRGTGGNSDVSPMFLLGRWSASTPRYDASAKKPPS